MAMKQVPIRFAVEPGYFIREELEARGWSQEQLAAKMGRPYQAVNAIINGHKIITAETAIELGQAFGVSAMYWLNLETAFQLYKASQKKKVVLGKILVTAGKTPPGKKVSLKSSQAGSFTSAVTLTPGKPPAGKDVPSRSAESGAFARKKKVRH